MEDLPSSRMNPFQWYVGKRVELDGEQYLVEGIEIGGRELAFRATHTGSRAVRYLSMIDLLRLEAGNACFS